MIGGLVFALLAFIYLKLLFGLTAAAIIAAAIILTTRIAIPINNKVAISLGGAVIPLAVVLYVMDTSMIGTELAKTAAAMTVVTFLAAKREKEGIVIPIGIAVLVAFIATLLYDYPVAAAVIGTFSVFVADVLRAMIHKGQFVVGGAGLSDAVIAIPAAAYLTSRVMLSLI